MQHCRQSTEISLVSAATIVVTSGKYIGGVNSLTEAMAVAVVCAKVGATLQNPCGAAVKAWA